MRIYKRKFYISKAIIVISMYFLVTSIVSIINPFFWIPLLFIRFSHNIAIGISMFAYLFSMLFILLVGDDEEHVSYLKDLIIPTIEKCSRKKFTLDTIRIYNDSRR